METTKQKRPTRQEVPEPLTWNLKDLFLSHEAWLAELTALDSDVSEVTQFRNHLINSGQTLFVCLQTKDAFMERVIRVVTYANLKLFEDGSNAENQGNYAKVSNKLATFNGALSFIESEILSFPEGKIEEFFVEEPKLQTYQKNLLDLVKRKAHTLTPETEQVLASLNAVHSSPYQIYSQSKSSDLHFSHFKNDQDESMPLSFALYEDRYELSSDTTVRRNAYSNFIEGLENFKNTYAATYSSEVTKQITMSKIRGYDSVTEMLLGPQDVTLDMYNNQLDIIYKELSPHMQRLAKLKKRELGLDQMYYCDLKAPLDHEFNPEISYEKATEMILEALEVMGPEYMEIMKKGVNDRWVDRAENHGKMTGAFCSSPYGAHPYILMTWTDMMRGTFILAHELGHAGHFYLANKYQEVSNTRPSTYFVEAPSTMNELLLADHLINQSSDNRMKRWVILQLLGTYYHNFVTHLLEGEFQRRVYKRAEKGESLTAASLSELKHSVLTGFWGDSVTIDNGAGLTWMRQPHYYMGLYPYTYSAGLTASTAVAKMIKEEGEPAVERWIDVLKAGGTKTPLELLSDAGVDLSNPNPIREAVAYIGSLVDELEKSFDPQQL
ncbi:oligoendopeptidase F [Alteribacter populi]|uniref:oligoendopeptidase F n=1 Tax=Alteribacter populi TaxID=2011011 RepID=UPI000BBAC8DC|nr:oligoendopeptidase F [Alteribacter populi]